MNPAPKGPSMPTGPGGPSPTGAQPGQLKPKQVPALVGTNMTNPTSPAKKADSGMAYETAVRAMNALRKRDMEELAFNLMTVASFDAPEYARYQEACAELQFLDNSFDPAGLAELSACTLAVMSGQPHDHQR